MLLALVLAASFVALWRPGSFDERLVQLQVERLWPQQAATLSEAPLELRALLVDYADDAVLLAKAQVALMRYPEMAREVLLAFGDEPDFRAMLREYGESVIAPVYYFMHNEVGTVGVLKQAGLVADRLRALAGRPVETSALELAPAVERGRYAIGFVRAEGHDFIGQFVVREDGEVRWLQSERVLEGINTFFAGGIRALETKARLDQPIGIGDIGQAGIDVAIGVGVFKLVKAARTGTAATRQAGLANRSVALAPVLVKQSAVASRLLRIGAPLAAGYLMIRHPSLINDGFGWLAERLGWPVGLVQFGGWALLLLPLLMLAGSLLRPLGMALALLSRASYAAAGLIRGGRPRSAEVV
ncbi:MAG: hypothetical protein CVU28_04510 [Betaproteobacteria bacterium HGW-Betaproteobacteria-21]|nr:MAG: hypothetical protein CVU28_04510 [Betaproteobacteria bacterium HGW-Betaproteobacteria-21]